MKRYESDVLNSSEGDERIMLLPTERLEERKHDRLIVVAFPNEFEEGSLISILRGRLRREVSAYGSLSRAAIALD